MANHTTKINRRRDGGKVKDSLDRWAEQIAGERCYPEALKVYLPTCEGKCRRTVKETVKELNKLLQAGSSIWDGEGTWISTENGKLVTEPIIIAEFGHSCLTPLAARDFAGILAKYARKAKQVDIGILQNKFYLMSRKNLAPYERVAGLT